ncbi:molybdenum cofactor guanylyltransferase [Nocardioides sp. B-3]|uniref:molybdenum cofactor guanylyltransferase n=1 Tax=Nocardioides sp. B-3 TaxID=2895565 RepID=UPI0021530F83|nr:NTP transferase domain-containing protein [Nocardioides sp. B-3]UUZ60978.1 NTP transferase domain-containing protein [Nocardioides sp. B-3]
MDFDTGAAGFSGVLLAGGTAVRMDGIDKASIELGGRTLLEICLDSFPDADEVVVVGPRTVRTTRPVTFTVEDPPRGGPVAGLLTGVDLLLRPARLIGVLAVDMPRVSAHTFRRLRDAATDRDGAFPGGRGRATPALRRTGRRCAAARPTRSRGSARDAAAHLARRT